MLKNIHLFPKSVFLKCYLEKSYFTNCRGHNLLHRNLVVTVLEDLDVQGRAPGTGPQGHMLRLPARVGTGTGRPLVFRSLPNISKALAVTVSKHVTQKPPVSREVTWPCAAITTSFAQRELWEVEVPVRRF